MIGILSLIGVPPTSGFMAEWILFNGALQTGIQHMDSFRVVLFSLAIFSTVLTSSYLLNMYRKIFFGKLSSHYDNLKDVNRYAIIPMAFIAALTLFLGVYPDPIINPVISYSKTIFSETSDVSSLPVNNNINTMGISSTIGLKDQYERFVKNSDYPYFFYIYNMNKIINNLEIKN
jgi:NADH-quinone oxidoreductase subunit M